MNTNISNHIKIIFKPLHLACSIFGISFFNHLHSKWLRCLHLIYGFILFLLFTSSFLYRITNVSPKFCQLNAVGQSVIGIQQILGILVIIAIYYKFLFGKKSFIKILFLISNIDNRFQSMNIHFSYKRFIVRILFEVVLVCGFMFSSYLFFIFHYKIVEIYSILLEIFVSISPFLVINLNLLMFINMAWCVQEKFINLKMFLIDICAIDAFIEKNKIWKVKLIHETPHGLYNQLKNIAQIYELLYETVNQLNNIFGLPNLASMGWFIC